MAGGVPAGRLSIELVAEVARLQQDLDKAKRLVNAASGDIAKSARAANDNLAAVGAGMAKAGNGGKLAGHHIQNLAFQFQDLGVQIASGSNPMIAFMQQGSQIGGIMGQAGIGIGGLTKEVGGMVGRFAMAHPVLLAVAAATAAGAFAFKGLQDTLQNKAPVEDYIKTLGLTDEEAKKLTDTHVTLGDAAGAAWDMIKDALGLEDVFSTLNGWVSDAAKWLYDKFWQATASVYAAFAATYDNIGMIWKNLPFLVRDAVILAVNRTIKGIQDMANAAITVMNTISQGANSVLGTSFSRIPDIDLSGSLHEYSAAGKELASAFGTAYNRRAAEVNAVREAFEDRVLGRRNARLKGQADKLISDRTEKSLKGVEKAARDAAKEAENLAKWLDQALGDMAKHNKAWTDSMPSFLEQETEEREAQARVREGQRLNEQRLLDVYLKQVDAIRQMGGLFDGIGGIIQGLATGNFMNIGGKFGGLLGTLGGTDTGLMAESKFGAAGNELDEAEQIGTTIADHMTVLFRKNGEFFQGLSTVLANAAIGSTVAGLAGGNKLGGGIGGAIGGFLTGKNGPFGKALEGGLNKVFEGLGSFAGPLGSIAGGLLGGVVGGLFKPAPKYGTSKLYMNEYGELDGRSTAGNDAASNLAAPGLAGGVAKGLMGIAEQRGAEITGVPNIALGTFDGKYRVNVEGRGGKMDYKGNSAKGLHSFGDDQQAAIEFAIQKSIEGAVLTGISAASIKILKSGQDLEKAIQKAVMIEDIPRELQRRMDPVGYAIDELNKKWMRTVDALREGGATVEQMTQAQKLYGMELAEAKENAGSATQAMKDFLKAMNMGSSSPLSLREQAMNAKSALDPFLAQINAGKSINQDKYLEAAQTYLDIERQMYGSTARYFEAFDAIQAATNKAIATVDNAAPIRTTSDPFIEQTASATKSMAASAENQAQLMAQQLPVMKDMAADMKALRQQLAASFAGSKRNFG